MSNPFKKPSVPATKKSAPVSPILKPTAKDDSEIPKQTLEKEAAVNPGYSSLRISANSVAKNLRKLSITVKEDQIISTPVEENTTVKVGNGTSKSGPIRTPSPPMTSGGAGGGTHYSLPTKKPVPFGGSSSSSSASSSPSVSPILSSSIPKSIGAMKKSPLNGSANLSSSAGELPSYNPASGQVTRRPLPTPGQTPSNTPISSSPVNTPTIPVQKPPVPAKSFLKPVGSGSTTPISSSPSLSSPVLSSSPSPTTFSGALNSSGSLEKPVAKKPALPPRNELSANKGTIVLPRLKKVSSAQKFLATMSGNDNDGDSSDDEEPLPSPSNSKKAPISKPNGAATAKPATSNLKKSAPPKDDKKPIKPTTTSEEDNSSTSSSSSTSTTSSTSSSPKVSTKKDPVEEAKTQRNYLVQEILSTERKYVNSMSRIITIFIMPLKDKAETKEKILSLEDINSIFNNIETIFLLHKTFLNDLEARISQWSDEQKLGDVFLNFAPYLRSYIFYSNAYNNTMLLINSVTKSNPAFQSFLQKCLQKPSSKGLNLSAYLIMPIQRIPRYRLLLEQIIKYSPESHIDYNNLQLALVEISKVASQLDERLLQYQIQHRVLDIQNSLNGLTENIVTPTRVFKKEGDLKKISDRVVNTRHFFLFSDLLIYSKKERKNTYRFKYSFPLATCWIQDLPDTPRFTNLFQIVSQKKNYFLSAPSPEEKASWMQMLNEVINKVLQDNPEFQVQRESIVGKRGSTTTKEILSELDKKAGGDDSESELRNQPLWLKDQMTKDCMLCKSSFTITKRRHHCRKCFKIFCGSCCPVYDFSQYIPGKKIRLCKTCNEEVSVQLSVMAQNEEFEQQQQQNDTSISNNDNDEQE